MIDTCNNVLTINNDGDSHKARLAIGQAFLVTGDRPTADKKMLAILQKVQAANPNVFDPQDKSLAVLDASASELVDDIVASIEDSDATLAKDVAGGATLVARNADVPIAPGGDTAFKLPTRRVAPDVQAVLKVCRIEKAHVYLPATKLDRKLYEAVNDVLTSMGGKWRSGKTQAHVFADVDPDAFQACFADLQATGSYTDPKDLSFFPTPAGLAKKVVEMAQVEAGMNTGEFSAGNGAIALELAQAAGGRDKVFCVELFPPNVKILRNHGFHVHEGDFLLMEPPASEAEKYDRIVINPPFSNFQDAAHVAHACKFLKESGRLVAITSTSWQHQTVNRKAGEFRNFLSETKAEIEQIAAGEFKSSGTMVATIVLAIDGVNLPWYHADRMTEVEQEEEVAEAPAP